MRSSATKPNLCSIFLSGRVPACSHSSPRYCVDHVRTSMVLRPCKISSVHGWRMLRAVNISEVKHCNLPETSENGYARLTNIHADIYTLNITPALVPRVSGPVGAAAAPLANSRENPTFTLELQRFDGHFFTLGHSHLLHEVGSLVVGRTHVADRRVPPGGVVEALDVLEDGRPRRFPGGERTGGGRHLGLERGDE